MEKLRDFLDSSYSVFHVIENIADELDAFGFEELYENDIWNIKNGGKYYVIRNMSSIIAFKVPEKSPIGFMITASHSDRPCFKIRYGAEVSAPGDAVKLSVEKYGGMVMNTWLDRPLSIAGRVIVKDDDGINAELINIDKDLLMIPGVAVHLKKDDDGKLNPAVDLQPLLGQKSENKLTSLIANELQVKEEDILGADLYLYNRMKSSVWGLNDEFISSQGLDDLQCVFGCKEGFLSSEASDTISVLGVFDNEEVGSSTKQGAASDFLETTLKRINEALGGRDEAYARLISNSMMVSADNAHAVHPNHPELSDPVHAPKINGGIVIKYNANQRYATDGVTDAVFRLICERANVPVQSYSNKPDIPGGSTLGSIASSRVSVKTIDIGLPQLSMHSSYETAGVKDTEYLIKAAEAFYESSIF